MVQGKEVEKRYRWGAH